MRTKSCGFRCFLKTLPILAILVPLAAACDFTGSNRDQRLESSARRVTDGPFTGKLAEAMSGSGVPAVSLAVIDGLELEWARGYGVTNSKTGQPVDSGTLFQASSITKGVTSAVALKLVEQGALGLDGDVNETLRTWKLPESPFISTSRVTLRELLSHTACVNRPDGGFGHEGGYPTTVQILNGVQPATNPPVRTECIPGSRFRYSNFGYVIVQQLVEDATGLPFPSVVRELALQPLRMESSTLEQPLPPRFADRAAFPHDGQGAPRSRFYNPGALAQGGLWTTPTDLARFLIEIMRSRRGISGQIFSTTVTGQMLTPHYRGVDGAEFWGLGIMVVGDWGIFHAGSDPGFRCLLAGFPLLGKGFVVMLNGENGEPLQLRLLLNFLLEYVVRPLAPSFIAGGLSALVLLSGLAVWTVSSACRRIRRRERRPRPPRLLAGLTAALILGTAVPFIASSLRPGGLVSWSGGTPLAKFIVVLMLLGAALSCATAAQSLRAWRDRIGSATGRVFHSAVALSALTGSVLWLRLSGLL